MMRSITVEDITAIRCISDVALSPDGARVAVTVVSPDTDKNEEKTDVWLADTDSGAVRQLTWSGKNPYVVWEDARTILLQTERDKDDEPAEDEVRSVFYRLPVDGGEAHRAFTITEEVEDIRPFGDGVFVCQILTDSERPVREEGETDEHWKERLKEAGDVHVLTEVPFWGDGTGFISGKRSALYLYTEATGELTKLTSEKESVRSFDVQDGRILYVTSEYEDVMDDYNRLWLYTAATGEKRSLVAPHTMAIAMCALTDSGVCFAGSDMKTWGSMQIPAFYRMNPDDEAPRKVWETDRSPVPGMSVTADILRTGRMCRAVRDTVFWIGQTRGQTDIWQLDKNDQVSRVLDGGGGAVTALDTDGERLFAVLAPVNRAQMLVQSQPDSSWRQIFDPNEKLWQEALVQEPEACSFVNGDGETVEGWVIRPVTECEGERFPALLSIHGGPRGAYGTIFFHEMQAFAAMGYYVFYCNPHGSEGYGESFADLREKYGSVDYRDLMDFTDVVLERYPQIDPGRLGVMGGSYGGFMCNWIEGHTDRFAAIASQRSVANWISDFGTSEIGITFGLDSMGGTMWDRGKMIWEQSPLSYAPQGKTPILLLHSTGDHNCGLDQAVQMFTAMKYHNVPTRLVVFEGESHGLSRKGKPRNRMRRLREMSEWFSRYLGRDD